MMLNLHEIKIGNIENTYKSAEIKVEYMKSKSLKVNTLIIHQGILDKIGWNNFKLNGDDFIEKLRKKFPLFL